MNRNSSSTQPLPRFAAVAVIGLMGVVAANAAIAQPLSGSKPSVQLAQTPSIQGSWRLANMTEPPFPTPMVPVGDLTAEFVNGSVAGSGGCNRFKGGYTSQGNQLKIGPLASTFKACEQPIMQQESRYLKALQAAERYEVNQDGLQIFYQTDQGEGVLRFTSQTVRGLW